MGNYAKGGRCTPTTVAVDAAAATTAVTDADANTSGDAIWLRYANPRIAMQRPALPRIVGWGKWRELFGSPTISVCGKLRLRWR